MSRRGLTAFKESLRSVAAVLSGYIALIVGTTLVQETLLGGVSFRGSAHSTLLAASLLTPLAGAVAGAVTGAIARLNPVLHTLPIVLAIGVETTVLYRTGRVDGPLWFEAMAGTTLAAAVIAGGVVMSSWRKRAK